MAPVHARNSAIPGAIPQKEKTCLRSGWTAMQNFTPIGKAPAEKSVIVHNEKESNSQLSIPCYTTYGGITILK